MPAPAREPQPADTSLRQLFGIETPEHVALHVDLAGLGSRAAAGIVDTGVAGLGLLLLFLVLALFGLTGPSGALVGGMMAVVILVFDVASLASFVRTVAVNRALTPG